MCTLARLTKKERHGAISSQRHWNSPGCWRLGQHGCHREGDKQRDGPLDKSKGRSPAIAYAQKRPYLPFCFRGRQQRLCDIPPKQPARWPGQRLSARRKTLQVLPEISYERETRRREHSPQVPVPDSPAGGHAHTPLLAHSSHLVAMRAEEENPLLHGLFHFLFVMFFLNEWMGLPGAENSAA